MLMHTHPRESTVWSITPQNRPRRRCVFFYFVNFNFSVDGNPALPVSEDLCGCRQVYYTSIPILVYYSYTSIPIQASIPILAWCGWGGPLGDGEICIPIFGQDKITSTISTATFFENWYHLLNCLSFLEGSQQAYIGWSDHRGTEQDSDPEVSKWGLC